MRASTTWTPAWRRCPKAVSSTTPPAFDERSRRLLASLAAPEQRIEVTAEDACAFACNVVRIDRTLILSLRIERAAPRLGTMGLRRGGDAARRVRQGRRRRQVPDAAAGSRSGGGKGRERRRRRRPCAPRRWNSRATCSAAASSTAAFDAVEVGGGAIRIERLHGGERADQTSRARLRVSAPDEATLVDIQAQLKRLAAFGSGTRIAAADDGGDAALGTRGTRRRGAGGLLLLHDLPPQTCACAANGWRVMRQRMDAAIVVEDDTHPPQARCAIAAGLEGRRQGGVDGGRRAASAWFTSAGTRKSSRSCRRQ